MQQNIVIASENCTALQQFPDDCIDLIYADPPFNTGRDFASEKGGYSDKSENTTAESPFFLSEICTGSELAYFASIIPTLSEIRRVLKPTGALYWHCDWRTSYLARVYLNYLFGRPCFRNEIIWKYQISMPYDKITHIYKNDCDAILFYAKPDHELNHQFHPLTYKQIKEQYPYVDSSGRKYRYTDGLYKDGSRIYADENKGTRVGATWTDIPIATGKERIGYPTQKPLALLNRIISASSNEGDTVLDPFCGSGTTLLAAKRLNRKWIGIDRNPEAVEISQRRLA